MLRYRLESGPGGYSKVFAGVIIAGGLYIFSSMPLAGLLAIACGVFPFLLYKCLEIDLSKRSYCMGLNLLGHTIGEIEPFPGVQFIFLKKNRTISRSNSRAWSSTYSISFDGYILLSDGTKLLIVQERNKERAMKQLELVAQDLQTEVRDLTNSVG
ncbi:hypothetical protein [Pontibacter sp. 13R65]